VAKAIGPRDGAMAIRPIAENCVVAAVLFARPTLPVNFTSPPIHDPADNGRNVPKAAITHVICRTRYVTQGTANIAAGLI
jgi:hypothetical protein